MDISLKEMYEIFNCGYGMLVFIDESDKFLIDDYDEITYLGKVVNRTLNRIHIINN